jgi:hypothetical protein
VSVSRIRLGKLLAALIAALALVVQASAISSSTATFSAQKSNPSNSFASSSYFGFFGSGFYLGNGTDNRAVGGVGFRPDLVIVKGNAAQTATARTSTMSGDAAKPMTGATALTADQIQSLDATGFTVGTNASVNATGTPYEWMAFRAQDGLLKVGSYTGNGSSQSISGLGFSPEYVAVFAAGAGNAVQRYSGMTTSFQFDNDTGNAQRITALGANGFTVGNQSTVNANGTTYHWIAFNDSAGIVDVSSYTGNNTDSRNIAGVGFRPEYVLGRANDTSTGRLGAHRPATLPGDSTLRFNGSANVANAYQALQSDGFQVGTDTSVNASGVAYHYLAVRDTPTAGGGGCTDSGSQSVAAAADSYVDQNSPNSNFGTNANLYVTSRNANRNRRTLVRFNLPSIPSGCSLTGSSLKLFSSAASGGRTIDLYRAGGAWTEGAVTWNTAPSPAGTATSRAAATGNLYWDATAQVQAMYSGTNNGFLLRDQTEDAGSNQQQTYQSRDGTPDAQDPELRVTWG